MGLQARSQSGEGGRGGEEAREEGREGGEERLDAESEQAGSWLFSGCT